MDYSDTNEFDGPHGLITIKNTFISIDCVEEVHKPRRTHSCPARLREGCISTDDERIAADDTSPAEPLLRADSDGSTAASMADEQQTRRRRRKTPSKVGAANDVRQNEGSAESQDACQERRAATAGEEAATQPVELPYVSRKVLSSRNDDQSNKQRPKCLKFVKPRVLRAGQQNKNQTTWENVAMLWKAGWSVYAIVGMLFVILLGHCSPRIVDPRASDIDGHKPFVAQDKCAEAAHIWLKQAPVDEPSELYEKPIIVLYSPCYYKEFAAIAHEYFPSATAWHWVQTEEKQQIEVIHWHEQPRVLKKRLGSQDAVLNFLRESMLPRVGRFTDETSVFYGSFVSERGLILGLFDPSLSLEAVDRTYRPMLTEVASLQKTNDVAYMDTNEYASWITSEFGVTSFPTIAVFKEYPGEPFLYTGRMEVARILEFLREVKGGNVQAFSGGWGGSSSRSSFCDGQRVLEIEP